MSVYGELPRKHQRFVDAYIQCGNATQALRETGWRGNKPGTAAWKLMHQPNIKTALEERNKEAIEQAGIRNVQLLRELASVAFFNPKDMFTKDGNLIPIHLLPDHVAAAIASFDYQEGKDETKGRVLKFRAHDKVGAAKLIGQFLKLFTDRIEHSGPKDGPIEVKETGDADFMIAQRIGYLLAKGVTKKDSGDTE